MANKFYIVPNVRSKSASIKESSGIEFLCPANTVMTGRWHKGDENGQTQYEYATLKAIDEQGNTVQAKIEVTDIQWGTSFKESSGSGYYAPANRVLVGRYHKGDENGQTRYATAIVKVNGEIAQTIELLKSTSFKESFGTWFVTDAQRVLVGRVHKGDENGQTYYVSAKLVIDSTLKEPAPEGTRIVPYIRTNSQVYKESSSDFVCPPNTVMTGRTHSGDENGNTIFQFASLKAINTKGEMILGNITVEDIRWEVADKESSGMGFTAEINRVIVGRRHFGDENASSQYATGIVKFNGHIAFVSNYIISEMQVESNSRFSTMANQVITAQYHYGDENGYTYYGQGEIYCQQRIINELPFDVIITLHKNESYFPMSATDFIILSRYRKYLKNHLDQGYNKNTNSFETSDSKSLNYYNIPLNIINNCYSKLAHKRLFNYRPHDHATLDEGEGFFLQPFAHLHGVNRPNGIVPTYLHKVDYTEVDGTKVSYYDLWLFFGYNDCFPGGHEGDWEHFMVEVVNNKIRGAWLSSHSSFVYHSSPKYRAASQLEIKTINGRQQLTVYCAKGSHALYATLNDAPSHDSVSLGDEWKISDNVVLLSETPWKLFAGAWGEVGQLTETTGPLGAWYKRFDFWYHSPIALSSLIKANDTIIVPDKVFIGAFQNEAEGAIFEAPENMVVAGRRHGGDENGSTVYLYATLKAINGLGQIVNGNITLSDAHWSEWKQESNSIFIAPVGYVIIGRQHKGDENGNTRYKIAKILFNGKVVTSSDANSLFEYQLYTESSGAFFEIEPYFLYIGRNHTKDENGITENYQGLFKV